jgi:predicted PurR-regulated permease PerM
MDNVWFEALVIILSVFLAVFLIVSIILATILIKIARQAKRIVDQAEQIADRAEHISAFFEKTATPVAIFKLVSNISEAIQKKAGRRK